MLASAATSALAARKIDPRPAELETRLLAWLALLRWNRSRFVD